MNIHTKYFLKRSVFRNECGGLCGKPLKRNAKNKSGFLCRKCAPKMGRHDEKSSVCYHCPFEVDCIARVQLGLWIRCETPDIADLERLRYAGGLDNEQVRSEVKAALAWKGNRYILENAVSKSAQLIYQSRIEMPIGIRGSEEDL